MTVHRRSITKCSGASYLSMWVAEEEELSWSRLLQVDAVSAADEEETIEEGGNGGKVERSGRSLEEMVASSRLSLSIPMELQSSSS